jgi:DmsE family decaheme c-type cytochrome
VTRFTLRLAICELFVLLASCGIYATAAPRGGSVPPSAVTTNPEAFIGAKSCAMCHSAETKGLGTNPHAKLSLDHNGKGITCEGCHGPGRAHVESGGDSSKIFSFTKSTPAQVDQQCLNCHQGDHASFDRSAHGEAKVSCTNCHGIHKSDDEAHLLKISQPTLCYSCHADVKPAFSKAFHHKVNEGLMQCSDCHDPHGTFKKSMVKSAAQDDAVCIKCHQENAGPFIYEHPVVKTEGCTFCHSPHGSSNPRLLARNNMNQLCLQCHTGLKGTQFTAGGPPTSPVHDQSMQYTSCITCHSQIHGSNVVDTFIR